jgi:pimeloyl-ACP methyl ester carboxylesterase
VLHDVIILYFETPREDAGQAADVSAPPMSKWLRFYRLPGSGEVGLFCFPCAGGTASMYRPFARRLPSTIDVVAVQPPGRESRIAEAPYDRMEPLVAALLPILADHLRGAFAFFGHSMGARVALSLTRALRDRGLTLPGYQRDLSVSHNKLGDLVTAAGDLTTATRHYQAGMTMAERLAAADPGNTQYQRDLSISHNKMGDLARAAGDSTTAAQHYQASPRCCSPRRRR